MKISIGTKIKEGPWGGGNLFAINLKHHLEERGYEVINHLDDQDIDVILITEPRKTSESSAFTHMDVLNYLSFVNEETMVVHRINECDERKGTNYVNRYMIEANKVANFFKKGLGRHRHQQPGLGRSEEGYILPLFKRERSSALQVIVCLLFLFFFSRLFILSTF